RRLRSERSAVEAQIAAIQAATQQPIEVPTQDTVVAMLGEMSQMLSSSAEASLEDGNLIRELIDLCTGGRIELFQKGIRTNKRGWLEGRFTNHLVVAVMHRLAGIAIAAGEESRDAV